MIKWVLGMDRYIYWIILRRIRRPLLVPFMSDCQISKAGAKNIRLFKIVSVFAEGDSNSDKMWHFWHLGKIMISKVHLLAGYCYSWHFTFYIHGQNIFHWQILTSLTIKGCVRLSVCLSVTSFHHFWFKCPQPVQWHWIKYLNTSSQGSGIDLNI